MLELETGLEALAGRVARHRLKPPVQLGVLIISRFHTNAESGIYSVPGPPTRSPEFIPFLARQRNGINSRLQILVKKRSRIKEIQMNFEVYCDESHPDLFTSHSSPQARFLMIGSLWLPTDLRGKLKKQFAYLKEKHHIGGEIKWAKVSPSKLDFYFELVDLFVGYGLDLRFLSSAITANQVEKRWYENDQEFGFYKVYYQTLHHWISDFNRYTFFCDIKTHRHQKHLATLHKSLCNANLSSEITQIQALPAKEALLIQLTDFLLGIASARLNESIQPGGAKDKVIQRLESYLKLEQLGPTEITEQKFNIHKMNLVGGW